VSRRTAPRLQRVSAVKSDVFHRHFTFWLAALFLFVLAFWLLNESLLPFIAGLAIAHLLTPLTDRLERLGVNRLAAALLIITEVVLALIYLILFGRAGARRAFAETGG
jgi:predicted PurR-regulated permease PerM